MLFHKKGVMALESHNEVVALEQKVWKNVSHLACTLSNLSMQMVFAVSGEMDGTSYQQIVLQVVWRAIQNVGCGKSVRYSSDGQVYRNQVCTYELSENCGVCDRNWIAEV